MGVGIGRATTRAHPPHPLPARPYYTANRPAQSVYRRGRGGCGRGDGALVAARPCPPQHLFSLFEMYWGLSHPPSVILSEAKDLAALEPDPSLHGGVTGILSPCLVSRHAPLRDEMLHF